MKAFIALSLALVATACGTAKTDSATSGFPGFNPNLPALTERSLFSLEGSISDVVVKSAEAPAQGIWTEITVEYLVDCSNRFENAALSSSEGQDGKIKIYSSAYASASNEPQGPIACQAFSHEAKTLTLPGIVSKDQLELVNLNGGRQEIPNDTIAIASASNIKVTDTRSLCPEGVMCALGGTIVELQVELSSCVNTLGPVAFSVEQVLVDSKLSALKLAVHAIDFVDKQSLIVDCAQTFVTTEITLPMTFPGTAEIQLSILN